MFSEFDPTTPDSKSATKSLIAKVVPETSLDRSFDYSIPPEMVESVSLGSKVKVSFGSRTLVGYVIGLGDSSSEDAQHAKGLKPLIAVLGAREFIPPHLIKLAHWMAQYYISPLGIVLQTILPQAVRAGKSGYKRRLWVEVKAGVDPALVEPQLKRAQLAAWLFLAANGPGWLSDHLAASEIGVAAWKSLAERNFIVIEARDQERDPFLISGAPSTLPASEPHNLSLEQAEALQAIQQERVAAKPKVILLHGVTGSGKTEVYLQAIAEVVREGFTALILVPEIALTPQTVDRFRSRFVGQKAGVAVLHSHLSVGERHDQWQQIRSGRAKIVIGVRSAVFAPLEKLKIIVVDEEHEPSYKQEDSPHYQARDVAIMRANMEGAVVVLGSATPSLESYHHAQEGKYRLCQLLRRPEEIRLPTMHVVDLRTKAKAETTGQLEPSPELKRTELIHNPPAPPAGSLISPKLETALRQRLDRGEQAIIFLNRRGYSSSIQCTECGLIEGCPRCSVALTFHRQAQRLRCHLCDHDAPVPNACPSCGHFPHKYSGTGTEKVEHALKQLFPDASIGRMDADTMRARGAYTHFLREFADGKIDFLVGTQMIAKGLHFPNVTCVGVVNSDMALLIPDFRAGERVFQLLMQVSGRSGRGQLPGEVFVQTRVPFHPSIQFARHNDYSGFAESEMDQRQATGYPPFSRLIMVTGKGRSEEKVSFVMDQIAKELNDLQLPQTEIIGPNPAPLAKVEDRFRYQIFLRTTRITTINSKLRPVFLGRIWMDEIQVSVNVDPTDLQ